MFEELLGLPAHPLLVHAAVVFAPLLIAGVVVYSFAPSVRRYIGWAVLLLGVGAPIALWFARQSGEALFTTLVEKGYPPQILAQVDLHKDFGDAAAWAGTLLGVLAIALVLFTHSAAKKPATGGSRATGWALIALNLLAAGATAYYVFKTGDTGAQAVWSNI
ncbi:DUF2231 domain-containing protein [Catellatospora coxensis]|uniref:DUF2231 domain-containing protein n=1 Tax=Catellatospora coxensis TaxID=310354 RepID=A0A8J3KXX4_9ACTN|nr:DUF2231 domain-containing protein [Catellatospora coxensis]GIG10733.1 hypothetical protein Cco03nite_74330 [Catellatospora coxensis]